MRPRTRSDGPRGPGPSSQLPLTPPSTRVSAWPPATGISSATSSPSSRTRLPATWLPRTTVRTDGSPVLSAGRSSATRSSRSQTVAPSASPTSSRESPDPSRTAIRIWSLRSVVRKAAEPLRDRIAASRDLRLHLRDVSTHVGRGLRVRVAQRRLRGGNVLLGPGGELEVDRAQELDRRGQADVGDRRALAADEPVAVEEEGAVDVERVGDRRLCAPLRLRLHLVTCLRRRDLARVLREAERRVRGARDERIERADQVEHRVVDHRALARLGRIEAVQTVPVAEVRHDRAGLAERAARQSLLFEHRREMGGVLRQVLGGRRLAQTSRSSKSSPAARTKTRVVKLFTLGARMLSVFAAMRIAPSCRDPSSPCPPRATLAAGTPPGRATIACVASGVVTNRRKALASREDRSAPRVAACHMPSIGAPARSTRPSEPRRKGSMTV